ncbi:DUF5819 family protein [Streptomyces sp. SID1328]|uniref:DUF5819 family protein n=1 Tax=Streptomyces sp. SID1328 TaxID=2690250 RepID=UPI001F24480B|nr:DUF5819 family protein [Streptomyces sp. SID1328]
MVAPSSGTDHHARPAGSHGEGHTPSRALPRGSRGSSPSSGAGALSPPCRVVAVSVLVAVALVVCVHLGLVFLSLAPSNTVSKQQGKAVGAWVSPEFEQNWKLFAPNPLQQNVAVQVRAEVRSADGGSRTTGWYDLSAQDAKAIDGNPAPSHTEQNELRQAWDFFSVTHDTAGRPGPNGALSEQYVRRIAVLRLDRAGVAGPNGVVQRVQVRSRVVTVPPPEWSHEPVSTALVYWLLPWWMVSADEAGGGVR